MPSITLNKLDIEPGGRVLVRFGKTVREYPNIEAMRQSVRAALDRDDMINLALALALTRQPNLSNPGLLEGRTLTVDFTITNWGRIT